MLKILLIAGEASGDLLGANLVRALQHLHPGVQLTALGGEQMRQAGVKIIFDNHAMGVIGWWEVIKNYQIIRQAMQTIKKILRTQPPDLLILIDYPGFNLRMAKEAKRCGIKVLYYVSPQIWAWKYGRIKTIRQCVNHMAVLFPFEEALYRQEKVPVTYVGHPLASLVHPSDSAAAIFQRYHLNPEQPIVALFPGSRLQEVERLLPDMLAATRLIRAAIPKVQFAIPLASSLRIEDLQPFLSTDLAADIVVVKEDTYNLLSICRAAIVKSGTGTLEVALSGVPLVIIYKGNYINYWIARLVVRVKQIGLCNIVAQKMLAREFIQGAVTAENIAAEVLRLMEDGPYRNAILADLAELRLKMAGKNSSEEVAKIALSLTRLES